MTPTLSGRWQTRVLVLWTIGLFVTVGLMWYWGILARSPRDPEFWQLLALLGYVTLFGLGWDILYSYAQSFRWDHDWPLIFHFICGVLEGVVVLLLFRANVLPGTSYHLGDEVRFMIHYGLVFWATYWWVYGPMRILVPRWRFHGGELI